MSDAKTLTEKVRAINIEGIAKYTAMINDIGSMNKMMAPVYLRDFIIALDITSTALARAIQYDIEAKAMLEEAEAIAYLDRASDYLASKGSKDNVEARKMYVQLDPDVKVAAETKAKTEALAALLKNKLQVFRMAHDDVKKIVYGQMDLTPYEGF